MTIPRTTALLPLSTLLLSLALPVVAEDAPDVLEPGMKQAAKARTCNPDQWSWNQAMATVTPTGDLAWKPEPFIYQAGKAVRYIDFEQGADDHDGTSQQQSWKHHPWDPAAQGKAKECTGVVTYVFKRGVIYRGTMVAKENGSAEDPIRLTSDPGWGKGEAVIAGSELITGWKLGADRSDIPDAGKVWYADIAGYKPRCVFVRDGGQVERVELARIPNWKVSDPEEVKSEWWTLEQPGWWENGCTKFKVNFSGHRAWLGVDAKHLTGPASDYVGAIAHVEYGWVMGTPFPTRVEGFDKGQKGFFFQSIWLGDSENIVAGMHYYLEDKPNFLAQPGEFWFDEGKSRLYLRLPGDKDPNHAAVEVAKHINLIDSMGLSHVSISGLSFRFTNITWDLVQPVWADQLINNACIRIRGTAEDIRIANCSFDHCGKAVRIDAQGDGNEHRDNGRFDRIVISDNDIDQTDHGAIEVRSPGIGDLKVLRNHLHLIGLRNNRQDHCFAICLQNPETMEVAGNLLERTTGAGIFCEGGRGGMYETPLSRNLVHHNKAFETLLSASDWGGIETNGGPYFNYDNISGDPNGLWNGYNGQPGSSRLGMAFYWDHGYSVTGFNLIAYGTSDAWGSKLECQAGLYEAAATIENKLFNSTIYRFWTGSQWSPTGGRHFLLGDVFDDIGGMVFQHGKLKEDTVKGNGSYPHENMAYGKNVFSRVPSKVVKDKEGNTKSAFAVYEFNGTPYVSPSAMADSFASHPAIDGSVGALAPDSPLTDPAKHDFRPMAGSAAIGHGVKMFVPWTLARNVGEWHFRQDQADPTILLDDHFHLSQYCSSENPYAAPLYPLKGHGITAASYGMGPLEDWNLSALAFDGKSTYASCGQDVISAPFTYDIGDNKKATATGKDLWSPDIYTSSLLIEVYVQPAAGAGRVEVLVAKRAQSGYQLAINKAGGATLSIQAGDAKTEVASGAVIADGNWHHVIAELDRTAGMARIYTDGVKTAESKCQLPADASLANSADLLVGKGPTGGFFNGKLEFLRICRGSFADAKTTIEELYDWEFDGPFLRDFAGHAITGKRDAGALQHQ